jgi:hypothetical protein
MTTAIILHKQAEALEPAFASAADRLGNVGGAPT